MDLKGTEKKKHGWKKAEEKKASYYPLMK